MPEWITVAPDAPYFVTETGAPWTPIGQNDAITWPELKGLFRNRDLATAEEYLATLRDHGVTCLRLMLEYAHKNHRYIENPIGRFVPAMVDLWDTLFRLCEKYELRILLTPFDTFWTWRRWQHHPYNQRNGGLLDHPSRLLLCGETREAIKARLSFATERWGGSGVLFAWDLWNEIHPGQAQESSDCFGEFIHDLSTHVREVETRLHGRAHPQTVSLFGPEIAWRPTMPLREPIFRHPALDFANLHIYEHGTIDHPKDTVAAAIGMGKIVREALAEIEDGRPFFDSEHGPIHSFKDRKINLPEAFDDEYFRHMSWAHLASGGVGGGMRWPNRHPHVLTAGMRLAQRAMAGFLPLINWQRFRRETLAVRAPGFHALGCGDSGQAVVWLVRRGGRLADGRVDQAAGGAAHGVTVPMPAGRYAITGWDTRAGRPHCRIEAVAERQGLAFKVEGMAGDCAFAIRRIGG